MRKLLVVLFAVAVCVVPVGCRGRLAAKGPRLEAEPLLDIPKLEGIVIDGDAGDWGAEAFRAELLWGRFDVPLTHFSGAFRAGWSQEGLLLLCELRDKTLVEAETEDELWRAGADCLVLYVLPERGERAMLRVAISP